MLPYHFLIPHGILFIKCTLYVAAGVLYICYGQEKWMSNRPTEQQYAAVESIAISKYIYGSWNSTSYKQVQLCSTAISQLGSETGFQGMACVR